MDDQAAVNVENAVEAKPPCGFCQEEHAEGSPAWRSCQDRQVEALLDALEHPERWSFTVTDAQRAVIVAAHRIAVEILDDKPVEAEHVNNTVPMALREMKGGEDVVQADVLAAFWQDFESDMPEALRRRVRAQPEISFLWCEKKVTSILVAEKLPFATFETETVEMDLRLPGFAGAAKKVEDLTKRGFELYDVMVDNKGQSACWFYRRKKVSS